MNNLNYTRVKEKIQMLCSMSHFQHPASNIQFLTLIILMLTGSLGHSQNLQTYIQEAISNNPDIQAVEKQHEIATEKISEVNTLPNTEFSAGYMFGKEDMPTMWQGEFSVMQMLPWFGTISAREEYATAMADADLLEIAIEKKKITRDLSQSYFRLYEITQKQKVLDENIQLLQMFEEMALTSVEVGEASTVSVLRLQMRQNELEERKLVLEQDFEAEEVVFNKIMNREEVREIPIMDTLIIPEKDIEIDFSDLSLHPELTKFEELHKVVSQADALNKKESLPQLGVGMEYMLFTEMADMVMPMVSISIPIFNKKYKSVARQNKLRYEALDIQKEAVQNTLMTQLQKAAKSRNSARIRIETQDKNLKQAENATEILFRNYETGTIDFKEVLDVQELKLQFQINRVEAIGDYFKETSIVEYFTEAE